MVRLLNLKVCEAVRKGDHVWQWQNYAEELAPCSREVITKKTTAHCRCCGEMLDIGSRVLSGAFLTLQSFPPSTRRPKFGSKAYIHEHNCMDPYVVQTMDWRGKLPGHAVFVDERGTKHVVKFDISNAVIAGVPDDASTTFIRIPVDAFTSYSACKEAVDPAQKPKSSRGSQTYAQASLEAMERLED